MQGNGTAIDERARRVVHYVGLRESWDFNGFCGGALSVKYLNRTIYDLNPRDAC